MTNEYLIEFYPDNKQIKVDASKSILDASIALGIYLASVCNGLGTCGKCKVIVEEGKVKAGGMDSLTEEERKGNYYLACLTYPQSDLKVIIPKESRLGKHQILEHTSSIVKKALVGEEAGVAVDVGTTTVVAYLVDLSNNNIVDSASKYNKQMILGGDVLTRIDYAKEHGMDRLHELLVETINDLLEKLLVDRGNVVIRELSVAGNTTMTYMLLNKDPAVIKENKDLEEFKVAYSMDASQLGINSGGSIYSLPGVASYVGGDIVADIIASDMYKSEKVSMLIDVGTNGEIAIGCRDWLVACSTSAGPAFEGGEVSCGMRATTGAIDGIVIDEDIGVEYATIHNDKPRGICGSGFIDLVADLFLRGVIDHSGKFVDRGMDKVMETDLGTGFLVVPGDETATGRDIVITEKDIEGILLSKAAIYAGASTLTRVGAGFDELERIYVAGGFGYYLDVENSIVLGLLPDLPKEKFMFLGNGSVRGAYMVLVDEEKRGEAEEVAAKTTYFDLSGDKTFGEEYMAALSIPHQDLTRFPSVEEKM
ncbi:MAG: ASKHA domain-containing protein [Candidatus Altiarchaeota archaeon]|nr:ASKHA domain-containing protein [Candidatus Altiarchaeota archaeon]